MLAVVARLIVILDFGMQLRVLVLMPSIQSLRFGNYVKKIKVILSTKHGNNSLLAAKDSLEPLVLL